MNLPPEPLPPQSAEANIKSILEWLALAHGQEEAEELDPLYRQLLLLRETPIPTAQRIKLLDLLYRQAEKAVEAQRPTLYEVALPISRKLRQRIRLTLKLLETLTQDYFNTLAELFDPLGGTPSRTPQTTLRRLMYCITWQIRINHLIASPTGIGLWQQLHSAFRTARRLGLADLAGPRDGASIQQIYTNTLLAAIAQPASFNPRELEFIAQYIEQNDTPLALLDSPPLENTGIFWIDLEKDFPAHALVRRIPSADSKVLYFSCDRIADKAKEDLTLLNQDVKAVALKLPVFAETNAGKGVLRRLANLWGQPTKRRFSRRRQSYRTHLCAGLNNLWQLFQSPDAENHPLSEWMVVNESPEGYALMHMSGHTHRLRVGDVVALQAIGERAESTPLWHVCIVRWAQSENPEHIELGLQLLASQAIPAKITLPDSRDARNIPALILPEKQLPPRAQSLILPSGILRDDKHRIIVLVEKHNLEIREVRATNLDEQTGLIEIFSVSPDGTG